MTTEGPAFNFLDDLEILLLQAAERQPVSVRRPRRLGRRAGVLAFVAVLTAGSALAATRPWSSLLGNDRGGHPTISPGAPLPEQSKLLGILRRPQTDQDRGPAVKASLALVGPQIHGVETKYIRYLAPGAGGAVVVLVPAQRFGDDEAGPPYVNIDAPLCVYYPLAETATSIKGLAGSCRTTHDVASGRAMAESAPDGGALHLWGLVPDGVAQVVAHFDDGSTIEASVRNNFVDLTLPGPPGAFPTQPSRIRWLDAAGRDVGPPR